MSYSRWLFSRWYTYWSTLSGDKMEDQVFMVCNVADFTYEQLTADIEKCLDECEAAGKEREELRGYMQDFIEDVKMDY